ncbi:unnamed protein product [Darwinula stevensoni]|uniref:Uncharacterized protein n=1 Tax=Darwinula stevensoni TaxID=69355 RepID=A0A7R9A8H6_9CRUS|nr:unnamed protein product [Darwinula stevensoni]CAG0896375.1 unnamed protein product [Darwinula stevensoni]
MMKFSLILSLLFIFLPGILAQGKALDEFIHLAGQILESYEEVQSALELAHHVTAVFQADSCDSEFPLEFSLRVSVPMDPWSRIQLEDGSEDFITFNHNFINTDGNFLLVTGYLDATGQTSFVIYEISGLDGNITNSIVSECVINVGVFFIQKRFNFPNMHITTYDDLRSLLLAGTHVTFLGMAELCRGNSTTGFSKVQGGTYHLQFYIETNPNDGSEDIILGYDYMGLSQNGTTPTFNVVQMRVYPDGSVSVTGNSFLTTTWEDEYPFPEGIQCTLDDGVRFQYRPGTRSAVLQEYYMTDDNLLRNYVTLLDPATDEITGNLTYICPVGTGAIVSAPLRESRSLVSYVEVFAAVLNGVHLEARINYDQCDDPTGSGLNFTGVTGGAYLRQMFISNSDSPEAIISSAAYSLVTNYISGEGFAYSSFVWTLDHSNVAIVVPALWSIEGDQLTNLLGDDFFLECTLGEGMLQVTSIVIEVSLETGCLRQTDLNGHYLRQRLSIARHLFRFHKRHCDESMVMEPHKFGFNSHSSPNSGGQLLESYDEVASALELAHHVTAIFDVTSCTNDFPAASRPTISIPLDPWSRIRLQDGSSDFITFTHNYINPNGHLILLLGYMDATDTASFDMYEASSVDGTILGVVSADCRINTGVFFVQSRFNFPNTHITTYDDLKSLLLSGIHLTFLGLAELCEGNPTPGVSKAQGGSYHLQFYIQNNPSIEDIYLEYDYMGLSQDGTTPTFNVAQMRVFPDGSVNVTGSSLLTTTWEDEYPYPEGFRCTLDEGARFQYRQQEQFATYTTFAEAETALLSGKELQVFLDHARCNSPPNFVNLVGVRLFEWQQYDVDSAVGHEIAYTQLFHGGSGEGVLMESYMTDENLLRNHMTLIELATNEALANLSYTCQLGTGATVSAPLRESLSLNTYLEVYGAALEGIHLEVRINYDQCNDPTGSGLDFAGVTGGAYLRQIFVYNSDSPDSTIFSAAHAWVSNYVAGEGFADLSVVWSLGRDGVAIVVPALCLSLNTYLEVYGAALEGIHLEVRINYDQCNDPTGSGLDFAGVTGGAYLRQIFVYNSDSPDSTIFSAAHAWVSNYVAGEGFADLSVVWSLGRDGVAIVVPALWSAEGGQMTNLFGDDFFLECTLGQGLIVYSTRLD